MTEGMQEHDQSFGVRAEDSGDDNVDDNRAPAAHCAIGSRRRSKTGAKGCVLLGSRGRRFKSCPPDGVEQARRADKHKVSHLSRSRPVGPAHHEQPDCGL